ncbi:hypothetical protein Gohar_020400 [Gossypium harknessii]|uniref:Zinc knuckle CX2CX4HX4C domain-containing protein n=1 Tax=Gossypium harknessii TaxID=34285 RepID=A0A7J9HXI6_9ROSI|nr:hypothetical protein [Gossypium harknessii]
MERPPPIDEHQKSQNLLQNGSRGHFVRMTIYVNREVRLKPKIRIDGTLQRVEYEALPNACFGCGRYDHVQDVSPSLGGRDKGREDDSRKNFDTAELNCRVEKFGSWMLVGRKQRRKARNGREQNT